MFVGFEVVSKVSTTLHTPLMSGANAIHGVILVGAIIVTGQADSAVGLVARAAGGGARDGQHGRRVRGDRPDAGDVQGPAGDPVSAASDLSLSTELASLAYLVAAVCFILALKGLSSPGTARRGNLIGAGGAVLAVVRRSCPRTWTTCR